MDDVAIEVSGIGKSYLIRHRLHRESYTALRDVIAQKLRGALRTSRNDASSNREQFWALRDVSFDVRRGDVIGIIGRNGAGKSTLLKILSRITDPTEGRARLKGRVASLLEVGTGFHPELTGRENIYLNGAILGMPRSEIRSKFDEIVAFADVERFLDTPIKRYSSGMYVRLAFAVAAHLDPEILVVDEVLAVGDAEFQKRCVRKMHDVSQDEGRTILFVSHNLSVVRSLCRRGMVLHGGRLEYDGDVDSALSVYSRFSTPASFEKSVIPPDKASIVRVEVDEEQAYSGNLRLHVEFSSPTDLDPVRIGAVVHNQIGAPVFGFNTDLNRGIPPKRARHGVATLDIHQPPLHSGTYSVSIYLGEKTYDRDVLENAATFHFLSPEPLPAGVGIETVGATRVNGSWHIHVID